MLTRIIRKPTGFLNKIWRNAQPMPIPVKLDNLEITAPPIWPYRYQGVGISLCSMDAPMPSASASGVEIPKT